jgi:CBS domain containing-hemolysin-like protein
LGHLSVAIYIGLTMLLSPLVFLVCDLLPKNLYYRAPHLLLRRDSILFMLCYWLLLPASWPLVGLTKVIEWFAPDPEQRTELMLGRNRLVQLMSQGRREGLLTDVQSRLANGVLQIAPQPATASMTPASRVLGLEERATAAQILAYAKRFATPIVALRREGTEDEWFGYVRAVDAAFNKRPLQSLVRRMPVISPAASKLDALQLLQSEGEAFGVVRDGDRVLGVVSSRGLCEQLFRPASSLPPRPS